MKEFEEFIKKKIIRKIYQNKSIARDLIEESERKDKSLKTILEKIGLSNENANDIIEYCYDIIITLIRAKLYLEGLKSSGEGAHEAEISYLRKLDFSESEARFMDELRYFRNRIKYYGKQFDQEYAEKVIQFLNNMKTKLKKLIKTEK